MKQVIEWKKLPKDLRRIDKDLYHFLTKAKKPESQCIYTGRLWWSLEHEYSVCIHLHNFNALVPINKFSHYAEVED